MMALSTLAETDLVAALPRHLVARHASQFGLTTIDLPVLRRRDPVRAIATKSSMMDAGVAWLLGLLQDLPIDGRRLRKQR